jgi:hypothetical protein
MAGRTSDKEGEKNTQKISSLIDVDSLLWIFLPSIMAIWEHGSK